MKTNDKRNWAQAVCLLLLVFATVQRPPTARADAENYNYAVKWVNPDPYFIDVDADGNIYVAGRNSNTVSKYTSSGSPLTSWGGAGTADGKFNDPEGIAVDSTRGFVYLTDYQNNRVQKFDLNGNFKLNWGSYGSDDGQFIHPMGIAVDQSGNIYVTDQGSNRVEIFKPDGTFVGKFGSSGSGDGEFNSPESIAVDSKGNIYVGDEENNRVQKFNPDGKFASMLGTYGVDDGNFIDPEDVAVDSSDYIYVADSDNSRIQKFSSAGVLVAKIGARGNLDGQFSDPRGVAIDNDGNVYVADTGNTRIQKFTPITGGLSLACTDDRGAPLSSADIISTSQPTGQTPLRGQTDSSGEISFHDILPGSYNIQASSGGRVVGGQTVEVDAGRETSTQLNHAPKPLNDLYTTSEGTQLTVVTTDGVLANDTDPDGDTLHATKISDPSFGIITMNTDGSFTYIPEANYQGTDSFAYAASDGSIEIESIVTLSITSPASSTLDHFVFDLIDTQQAGVPFTIKLKAVDQNGLLYPGFTGSIDLTATQGATLDRESTGSFTAGEWMGSVTLSAGNDLKLLASGVGKAGESNTFSVTQRTVTLTMSVQGRGSISFHIGTVSTSTSDQASKAYSVPAGTLLELSAEPQTSDDYFDHWFFVGEAHSVGDNPLSVRMNSDVSLQAVFKETHPEGSFGVPAYSTDSILIGITVGLVIWILLKRQR
jgi:sugar lactone lactonase YvrE